MRIFLYGLVLVAVGVAPYLWSQYQASRADTNAAGASSADATEIAGASGAGDSLSPALAAQSTIVPRLDSPPIVDLAEAIRFDVTAAWLFQRWPRVTAGLPEGELQGFRVPLVTGAREDDVAGSLTYYFDAQQVCRKITLTGSAGDPRKIAGYIASKFGLLRRTSADPALQIYQTRWNGKPVSELKIKPVQVVKSTDPLARYDVQLVLNTWSRR